MAVAAVAIRAGVAYAGVNVADAHANQLWERIRGAAFRAVVIEGEARYDPELVSPLSGKSRKQKAS